MTVHHGKLDIVTQNQTSKIHTNLHTTELNTEHLH